MIKSWQHFKGRKQLPFLIQARFGVREKERSRMTYSFWHKELEGWSCPQLRWRRLGKRLRGAGQELSSRHVTFDKPNKQACISSRQLRREVWTGSSLGLEAKGSCSKISEMRKKHPVRQGENQKHTLVSWSQERLSGRGSVHLIQCSQVS